MDKDIRKYPYNLLVTLFHGDEADKLSDDSDIALEYVINETLTEREALFLRMRYKEGMTYAEIAEENGVSKGMTQQILFKAVHKLKHFAKLKYIRMGMHRLVEHIKETERALCEFRYKDKEQQIDPPDYYKADIAVLDLTVRTYNVLRKEGFLTIGDILEAAPERIVGIRAMGRKSTEELIDSLDENGFKAKSLQLLECYDKRILR